MKRIVVVLMLLASCGTIRRLVPAGEPEPPGPVAAATAAAPHVETEQHGDGEKPAAAGSPELIEGLGRHHHPIATVNEGAQRFFDQGISLVYAFNHEEAIRSFERAAALDPKAAMPHWGIALALGPNINLDVDPAREKAAHAAVRKALELAEVGPENERAYVRALARRYTDDPRADLKQLGRDYAAAMRELSRRYPDDVDAAALYAESLMNLRPWQLWLANGKPAPGTQEIVAVLESVLARDPYHLGANHYLIHAVEASPHPERALPSAARLEKLAPAAGHLVHMPSHVYMRTGFYAKAAASNEAAVRADGEYAKASGTPGVYSMMYAPHNRHFLTMAYAMEGRSAKALEAADDLAQSVSAGMSHGGDVPPEMVAMFELFMPAPILMRVRFEKWDEVLAIPEPDRSLPATRALWRYARGVAYVASGDLEKAKAEQRQLEAARKRVPAASMIGLNRSRAVLDVASPALAARILAAEKQERRAIDEWRKAVAAEDRLSYDEPPDWYYPVRESLGAALLRGGRAPEAERVFREDLQRNPRNPRSLFGLELALRAQKNDSSAVWVGEQFMRAWRRSDVELALEDL